MNHVKLTIKTSGQYDERFVHLRGSISLNLLPQFFRIPTARMNMHPIA